MLDVFTRLFSRSDLPATLHEPQLAVAALLVHLSAVDGSVTVEERATVRAALMDHYDLSEAEVDQLIREATRQDAEAVDFYRFTSALRDLTDEEKREIVRMMWQVVYADHQNHELEDNMVWRIAELIHVSARDRTILRNQMARGEKPATA